MILRHRFIASALICLVAAAVLCFGPPVEVGQGPLSRSASLGFAGVFALAAGLFLASWTGRYHEAGTVAGALVIGALLIFNVWRLMVPFRYVVLGQLWPEMWTVVEMTIELTLFATHWNAFLVGRRSAAGLEENS